MQVKMCPKCGSTDIFWSTGGIIGYVYTCQECAYTGPFIIEVNPEDVESFQKEIKKAMDEREGKPDSGFSGQ